MNTLNHLKYSIRMLLKNPGFTAVAVLSLALGIGVNSAVFSVAEAALLRSWPAKAPEQLAAIIANTPQGTENYFSYPDYSDFNGQSRSLAGVVAWSRHGHAWRMGSEVKFILDDWVSPNYFTVLGVRPQLGRAFTADDHPSAQPIAVISDAMWHRLFHADPAMVGKTIVATTGKAYTVIGIGPPHFRGLERGVPTDMWVPVTEEYGSQELNDRGYKDFELLARLRPGATPAQAKMELATISQRLADAYPAFDKAKTVTLISEQERLHDALFGALLLMAVVGLVLFICCANVAGLVLARSETRRREIAVRLALGASRGRLVRQLLTESALLALAGTVCGLILASWLLSLQPALMPPSNVEVGLDLRLNVSVIVFALATSIVAALIFGLAPALEAAKSSLIPALKSEQSAGGQARRLHMRNTLVVGEIALAVVLVTASGLLVRSLLYSRGINLGFDSQKNLVFFDLEPGVGGYTQQRSAAFFEQVAEKVAGLPGVRHASFARRMLLTDSGGGAETRVSIPGIELPQGQPNVAIKFNTVGPGYFETLGTRRLKGRDFSAADGPSGAPAVLISETMARRFWPDKDPIGLHIVVEDTLAGLLAKAALGLPRQRASRHGIDCQIIGVVEDAKINAIHEDPEPYMYFNFAQAPMDWGTLIVETAGDPRAMIGAIRGEIRHANEKVPASVFTLQYLMGQAFWQDQTAAGAVGVLGGLGMLLAAVGLYGVISFLVNRRRHEIGIRMALGAKRQDVLRLVLAQGLRLAAIGTGIGLLVSLAAMRLMSTLLFGVKPHDPITFGVSALIVVFVALAASYFPARRAANVDPIVSLRYE